jgi:hypothetical protein
VTADFDKAGFGRVVRTLAPYLDDVVFVGGWAQRLFRLHPLAASTAPAPLMTVDATATIQGVSAEKLRHVDLLLACPWTVELTSADGYAVGEHPLPIKICNPASYLAQKVLVLPSRRPSKRGKDILYIHDTLLLFGAALDQLQALWVSEIRPQLAKKAVAQVLGASKHFFGDVTDLPREAARVARGAGRSIDFGA